MTVLFLINRLRNKRSYVMFEYVADTYSIGCNSTTAVQQTAAERLKSSKISGHFFVHAISPMLNYYRFSIPMSNSIYMVYLQFSFGERIRLNTFIEHIDIIKRKKLYNVDTTSHWFHIESHSSTNRIFFRSNTTLTHFPVLFNFIRNTE